MTKQAALDRLGMLPEGTVIELPGTHAETPSAEAQLIGIVADQSPYEVGKEFRKWTWTPLDALQWFGLTLHALRWTNDKDAQGYSVHPYFDAPIPQFFSREWAAEHYLGHDDFGVGLTIEGDPIR